MELITKNQASETNSLELLHERAVVREVLPEALEDGADVVADRELIVELAGGAGVFNI